MPTIQEQIRELENKIEDLKKEDSERGHKDVLPLLQTGEFIFEYNSVGELTIKPKNIDAEHKLLVLMSGRDFICAGEYFNCSISPVSTVYYNEGGISLDMNLIRKGESIEDAFLNEVKELGITVNFTRHKRGFNFQIDQAKYFLKKVEDLEICMNNIVRSRNKNDLYEISGLVG